MTPRERIVLHADMDAFYASIEQRDHPELRGKPVIVGANSARGVVSAASYEARKFGVRSAMPGFRARELCPQGVFVAGDMSKYARVSDQVHRVFEEFTPQIEPLSLDEAFLDISGSLGMYGDPLTLGRTLKARVREETQLAVSCGIAENKLVAKMACSLGKPDGLLWVRPEQTRALLDPLPVRALWGVGPVAEKALLAAGYRTLADLANADLRALSSVAGERAAELAALARGEDDRPVEADREAKSYGEENTFERDQREREAITAALTSHAHSVARRLRHDGVRGRTITLKAKLAKARGHKTARGKDTLGMLEPNYPLLSRSRTLAQATDDAAMIRRVAIELWDAAKLGEAVRLVGVSVSKLESTAEEEQLALFVPPEVERQRKLGPALDAIRARFGEGVIGVATGAPEKLTPSMRKKRGE